MCQGSIVNIGKEPGVLASCENRVKRLCTVVMGTSFATDTLRQTIN
jgi:hypothetical protein